MSSLQNSSKINNTVLEVFKKEGLTPLNGKDLVKSNNNIKEDKPAFTNFSFLLDVFTEEQLGYMQLKVPNIQQVLIDLIKVVGYNKEFIINVVSGFIENKCTDDIISTTSN
jgi:hypothetical protein